MNKTLRILGLILACLFLAGNDGCPFDWREAIEEGAGDVGELTWKRADYVIGQTSRDRAETARPIAEDTLLEPTGVAFSGGPLFVSDTGNSRILAYEGIPARNGAGATFVLGQDDMQSGERGGDAGGLFFPTGVAAGSWGLAVADTGNDRILLWDSRPSSGPRDADRVFGQPALDQNFGPGCFEDALNEPWGVQQADERILVSDYGNNRLLQFEREAASGSAAIRVIGQEAMDVCLSNRGQGVPSADSFDGPAGFWTDGNRLAVADRFNNRVLLWRDFPSNGEPADVVLGQPDMQSRVVNADGLSRGMNGPTGVHWDGDRLFVSDRGNHRVLVYDSWPLASHPRPDAVLGQPDRNSNTANNTGDGTEVNARSLNGPEAVWSDGDRLLISDTGNARILIFVL
ncbi:NHL repeat-containing protein [Natronospira bacteriovora]|uniref:NHL repeat-containing protein n=1 Tax=Natronospira bacteriovora TaxID=3069753 RepID=A0ABU0WB10_9GAMM|nr:NHL repeat-containing protein [Natronospira sp. AB-CW4]MDQ2070645.1 NHL repeat-containing protein [Natronospira sp. AB-CW4]